jgi:hypothetical protein
MEKHDLTKTAAALADWFQSRNINLYDSIIVMMSVTGFILSNGADDEQQMERLLTEVVDVLKCETHRWWDGKLLEAEAGKAIRQ